jgi:G3E family GTPase
MSADVYIISGFLGAGKTTLIQKLLKEAFQGDKVVLVENDFGDISVDAALLKAGGVEVSEINAGCICCSLSGDFVKSMKMLLDRFHPDAVLIEPSGVGKLSDVAGACADKRLRPLAEVKKKITVVDAKRCHRYLDNFGEFFEDQIRYADAVLLSRMEAHPGQREEARRLIRSLNADAPIWTESWEQIDAAALLAVSGGCLDRESHDCHDHDHDHDHGHGHGHGVEGICGHDHEAEDVFDTVTIRPDRVFTRDDLKTCASQLDHGTAGMVLRAKGIVRGTDGFWNLQYLPGDLTIENCAADGDALCIIGCDLNREALADLFRGVI